MSDLGEDDSEPLRERIGLLLEERMARLRRFHFRFSYREVHAGRQHGRVLLGGSDATDQSEKVAQGSLEVDNEAIRFSAELGLISLLCPPHPLAQCERKLTAALATVEFESGEKCNLV